MPKFTYTPREELVCGKIDELEALLQQHGLTEAIYRLQEIRHDCERMEMKLISRKREAGEKFL